MSSRTRNDAGTGPVEVCLAMVILSVAALGAARLFGIAIAMAANARSETMATVLATQKAEQLRSLAWNLSSAAGLQPVSDSSTDLSREPLTSGGSGLSASPPGSLSTNVAGFVDFLDASGLWLSSGPVPPRSAVFIRRWSITPLQWIPTDTLVLRVLVTTVVRESHVRAGTTRQRLAGDASIVTLLTRKVR